MNGIGLAHSMSQGVHDPERDICSRAAVFLWVVVRINMQHGERKRDIPRWIRELGREDDWGAGQLIRMCSFLCGDWREGEGLPAPRTLFGWRGRGCGCQWLQVSGPEASFRYLSLPEPQAADQLPRILYPKSKSLLPKMMNADMDAVDAENQVELEEKTRLINQVLELQHTLEGLALSFLI
ncbi:PREDICTED: short coiled-coil protein [Miniopterus natalensis]|uniref:short coiled-coil protein n=1 Tax=Miniopterus natalensis TaxID=291302 RepID=UPI0007A6DC7B|nr:PREDICTED: short coiled-coil protein [Miniopterus natalensis]